MGRGPTVGIARVVANCCGLAKPTKYWVADIARLDECHVVTGGKYDKSVRLWDVSTGTELRRFQGHEQSVLSIAVLDPHRIVSASADKTLIIWDVGRVPNYAA